MAKSVVSLFFQHSIDRRGWCAVGKSGSQCLSWYSGTYDRFNGTLGREESCYVYVGWVYRFPPIFPCKQPDAVRPSAFPLSSTSGPNLRCLLKLTDHIDRCRDGRIMDSQRYTATDEMSYTARYYSQHETYYGYMEICTPGLQSIIGNRRSVLLLILVGVTQITIHMSPRAGYASLYTNTAKTMQLDGTFGLLLDNISTHEHRNRSFRHRADNEAKLELSKDSASHYT